MVAPKPRTVRKQYTSQFKEQIVKLCKAGHKCKRDIAEEYDIPESILYEWIKRYDTYGTFDKASIRLAKETDLERLQKENAQLRMENDILKRVALMLEKEELGPSKS